MAEIVDSMAENGGKTGREPDQGGGHLWDRKEKS